MTERCPESPWEKEWREYEERELGRPRRQTPDQLTFPILPTPGVLRPRIPMKPNQVRHTENLAIFTGSYHGVYYDNGMVRSPRGAERWSPRSVRR